MNTHIDIITIFEYCNKILEYINEYNWPYYQNDYTPCQARIQLYEDIEQMDTVIYCLLQTTTSYNAYDGLCNQLNVFLPENRQRILCDIVHACPNEFLQCLKEKHTPKLCYPYWLSIPDIWGEAIELGFKISAYLPALIHLYEVDLSIITKTTGKVVDIFTDRHSQATNDQPGPTDNAGLSGERMLTTRQQVGLFIHLLGEAGITVDKVDKAKLSRLIRLMRTGNIAQKIENTTEHSSLKAIYNPRKDEIIETDNEAIIKALEGIGFYDIAQKIKGS